MPRLKMIAPRVGGLAPRVGGTRTASEQAERRVSARATWRAWYGTAEWQALRRAVFVRDGFTCRRCDAVGMGKGEIVCDHVEPHRGERARFFDPDNCQTLCKVCHDRVKQAEERQGAQGHWD